MSTRIKFLAPIWNVDRTLLKVDLPGFVLAARDCDEVLDLIQQLEPPEGEILRLDWGTEFWHVTKKNEMLIAEADFELGDKYKAGASYSTEEMIRDMRRQDDLGRLLEFYLTLLRLVTTGEPFVPAWFFYRYEDGIPYTDAASTAHPKPGNELLRLTARRAFLANCLVRHCQEGFSRDYLRLACYHFNESYIAGDNAMQLLTLMIAMEALFNDGRSEVRYRLARGAAVVAGRTRRAGEEVFNKVKRLYDLRSALVHTGDVKSVGHDQVKELQAICRRCIVELIFANLPKTELSKEITKLGFSQWRSRVPR